MEEGWFKIYRKLKHWRWRHKPEYVSFLFHCLLFANLEDYTFEFETIKRGSFVTSIADLSREIGISARTVRTILKNLEKSGFLTVKAGNRYTIVSISNYDRYQGNAQKSDKPTTSATAFNTDSYDTIENKSDKPTTSQRQANDKQLTSQRQASDKNIRNKNKEDKNKEDLLGTDVPLSPEGEGVSDTAPEIPENGEKTDAADNTLTLTPPTAEKEKNCAKKEKAENDYKWDEIREWFNSKVAHSNIPQVRALNDKRKTIFRKAMKAFGREKVAEAVTKAATVPFLNGDNDRHWVADFDFILNENKLPRILENYYDHLHEKQPTTAKLTGSAYTLHETEKLLNRMEKNGNNTDTGTENFTLGEPADYIAVLGNL